jgi:hypothetical protein
MDMAPVRASAAGERPAAGAVAAWFTVPLAGSALLGLLAGFIWGEVAPRALLQEVGTGTAQLVNAETTAFIVADAWFCLISAAAGLITGLLGWRFLLAPRPRRPAGLAARAIRAACAAGLIVGAVAGAFVMLWLGERIGLSGYDHHLAGSPDGTLFPASLSLGAKSALAFWPMVTAVVILVGEWGSRRAQRVRHADRSADGERPS